MYLGHLLGASPKFQFYAQVLGSLFSVVFTISAWQLYDSAYDIPGIMYSFVILKMFHFLLSI